MLCIWRNKYCIVLYWTSISMFLLTGCEYVGTKLNIEEHGETCKHKNSADPPKCQALHSGVIFAFWIIILADIFCSCPNFHALAQHEMHKTPQKCLLCRILILWPWQGSQWSSEREERRQKKDYATLVFFIHLVTLFLNERKNKICTTF